jgi:hypothetical protein
MEPFMILRSDPMAKLVGGIIGVIILLIISAIRNSNKNKKAAGGSNKTSGNPVAKDSSLDKVLENQKKLDEIAREKKEDDSIWK